MKQLRLIATTVILSLPFVVQAVTLQKKPNPSILSKEKASLLVELTGKDISKESDMALYAEMLSAYDKNDEIAFKSRLQSLITRFPKSVYADNALFLAGRRALDGGNYPEAVKYFSRVEKEYPRSSRVPAARFAKAMTYKKMNLPTFSRKILAEVRAKYPGSPESFRADSELKLFN
ncbi:tol-pal system protein YbgF [compost metagenome]